MPTFYFHGGPRGRDRDFEKAINRRFRIRSRELGAAVSAVDRYIRGPSANNLRNVVNTIAAWKSAHPVEFAQRFANIWSAFHGQMLVEAMQYPNDFIECLDQTPAPPTLAAALTWVNAVNNTLGLQQFSNYACLDATTFRHCINGDQSLTGPVRVRETAWNTGGFPPFGTNTGMAIIAANRGWNSGRLTVNYNRINGTGGRGAVCTTFGYLAGHILTRGRPNGPRVELVSYPRGRSSHVFVIVGREGGLTTNNRIPNDWDAVVVDAWAAALGHPCVFANRRAFVFGEMTNNLQLVMQRPAS